MQEDVNLTGSIIRNVEFINRIRGFKSGPGYKEGQLSKMKLF